MPTYQESIDALDEQYRQRTAHLVKHRPGTTPARESKGPCRWDGCDSREHSCGLCSRHYQQLQHGILIRPDFGGYSMPDKRSFVDAFVLAAKKAGVTPGQLLMAAMETAVMKSGVIEEDATNE